MTKSSSPSNILVAGVGRSGTTILYRLVSKMAEESGMGYAYAYEPYLWNLDRWDYSTGQDFEVKDLNHFGLHVHTHTPLFLSEGHDLHDQFIDDVMPEDKVSCVKEIRCVGRLGAWLKRRPDTKVLCIVRNPIDTMNSAVNVFSLLGRDFHASDGPRLATEASAFLGRKVRVPETSNIPLELRETAVFLDTMTEAAFHARAAYPDNVRILSYEWLNADKNAALDRIGEFLGFSVSDEVLALFDERRGTVTKRRLLPREAVEFLGPQQRSYLKHLDQTDWLENASALTKNYEVRSLVEETSSDTEYGVVIKYGTSKTTVTWRNEVAGYANALERRVEEERQITQRLNEALLVWDQGAVTQNPDLTTLYVVTPSYNAAEFIDRTIMSVVCQAGPFNLIYHVQDGGSTDGTVAKLEDWSKRLSKHSPLVQCASVRFTYTSQPDDGMYDAISKAINTVNPHPECFVTWLNADDVLCAGTLASIAEIQQNNKDILWLGSMVSTIGSDDKIIGTYDVSFPQEIIRAGACDGVNWQHIQQEGCFFRKKLWDTVDGLNTTLRYAGDWDLWRRFSQHAQFIQAPWPLAFFRKHQGQLSGGDSGESAYLAELNSVISHEARKQAVIELAQNHPDDIQIHTLAQDFASEEVQIATKPMGRRFSWHAKDLFQDPSKQHPLIEALRAEVEIHKLEQEALRDEAETHKREKDILKTVVEEERTFWRAHPLRRFLQPLIPAVKIISTDKSSNKESGTASSQENEHAAISKHSSEEAKKEAVSVKAAKNISTREAQQSYFPSSDKSVDNILTSVGDIMTEASGDKLRIVPDVWRTLDEGPIKTPWIGCLHTLSLPQWYLEELGLDPLSTLSKKAAWKKSLKHCKGIFTFSQHSANVLKELLSLPIRVCTIPVQSYPQSWSLDTFTSNQETRIVQTGWWAKRIHGLHLLPECGYRRTMVRCDEMPARLFERERDELRKKHLYFDHMDGLVEKPVDLDREQYLTVLTKNLAFVHYQDASIPDVIIDCISTGTPLLVNPHPVCIEYLGIDYPLYYHSYSNAAELAQDQKSINKAHAHLNSLCKEEKFQSEHTLAEMKRFLVELA